MIRIELSRPWLLVAYRLLFEWRPLNHVRDHADLLVEHRHETLNYFAQKLQHDKGSYTIKFTSLQALSFFQMWINHPVPSDDLGAVVISYILDQINRQHENNKRVVRYIPGTLSQPGTGEYVVGG